MNTIGMNMAEWYREVGRRATTLPRSVVWMTHRERSEVAALLWGDRAAVDDLLMVRGYPVVVIDEPPRAAR